MTPVDCVTKIALAPGRVVLGRYLIHVISSFHPDGVPVIDNVTGVFSMMGALQRLCWLLAAFGASRLRSCQLGVALLGEQRLDLFLGLALAFQELGECHRNLFRCQGGWRWWICLAGLLNVLLALAWRHSN